MSVVQEIFGDSGGSLSPTATHDVINSNSTVNIPASASKKYILTISTNFTSNSDQSRVAAYIENGTINVLYNLYSTSMTFENSAIKVVNDTSYRWSYALVQLD